MALMVTVALMLPGCVVPDDDAPRAIDPSAVPFSLLGTSTTASTEPQAPPVREVEVPIYLVDSDTEQLVEAMRTVEAPRSVLEALAELLQGPNADELAEGLTSAISRSTTLLGIDGPHDGVVTVNLSDDLSGIGGQGQRLALAQVVFTVTAAPEIDGVLFAFEGEPSQVPDGQGQSTAEPLDRADFATFHPTVPTPPSPDPPQDVGSSG